MEAQKTDNQQKKSLLGAWKTLKLRSRIFQVFVHLFALVGFAVLGAWAFYEMGFTKNRGGVDSNNRYLADYKVQTALLDSSKLFEDNMESYLNLVALSRFYPTNAHLIVDAERYNERPDGVHQMIYAANMYLQEGDTAQQYQQMVRELKSVLDKYPSKPSRDHLVPWMNELAWPALKEAILKDKEVIVEAARMTGVEPRLIVSCLVGEQIRLFNSKREMYKQYLGPVKVLSVQSQFSYGVNGIKEHTARAVEEHLKDSTSEFYMGKRYENLLDFRTDNHEMERYNRLVDYRNHLYSYIYTGCILHQTMLQWKRAGYDISDRPDILCTLFNVGFSQSHPHGAPRCGGSHISVDGKLYTFGAIGFDFYYSGDLAAAFPYWKKRFVEDDGKALTPEEIEQIQNNMSNCSRPEKGLEYKQDDNQNLSW